jgi:predicted secreted acid phosphatase
MMNLRTASIALLFVVAASPLAMAQTIPNSIPNLGTVKSEIATYYTSGAYQADAAAVIAQAQAYVDERLAEHVEKPAVVLDIDDTSLSGYAYEAKHDFGYDSASYNAVLNAEGFPAILPTLGFAQRLRAEHVAIFFVTGRRVPQRDVTLGNLEKVGYPTPDGLYLRPVDDKAASVIPFKSHARAEIAAQGYTILESIGDQYSDLLGGSCERMFKMPNPMYFLP